MTNQTQLGESISVPQPPAANAKRAKRPVTALPTVINDALVGLVAGEPVKEYLEQGFSILASWMGARDGNNCPDRNCILVSIMLDETWEDFPFGKSIMLTVSWSNREPHKPKCKSKEFWVEEKSAQVRLKPTRDPHLLACVVTVSTGKFTLVAYDELVPTQSKGVRNQRANRRERKLTELEGPTRRPHW